MKNLILHYLAILAPLRLLFYVYDYFGAQMPSVLFIALFLMWCLLYSPFLTGRRMYIKGMIPKLKLVYNLNYKQFKEVYFSI